MAAGRPRRVAAGHFFPGRLDSLFPSSYMIGTQRGRVLTVRERTVVARLRGSFVFFGYGEGVMKFRPLHDRVVVRGIDEDQKTAGGIIIPDTAKEKPMQGKVVAVGPGARGDDGKIQKLDVKVGDKVLYGKWSGTEVKIDGKDLLIMKEADIMGIIE